MCDINEYVEKMANETDMWPWYYVAYGEKSYAFATVSAFPINEDDKFPEPGTQLYVHPEIERAWVSEDGTSMLIDEWIADQEAQNGGTICQFIAKAYWHLMKDKILESGHVRLKCN